MPNPDQKPAGEPEIDEKRFDAALRRLVQTPPKPHTGEETSGNLDPGEESSDAQKP